MDTFPTEKLYIRIMLLFVQLVNEGWEDKFFQALQLKKYTLLLTRPKN